MGVELMRVMSVTTKGLDEAIAELTKVADTKTFLPKTLYEGAGVVAKEMKTQISALKTSQTGGSMRYPMNTRRKC
jgi:hypothetical protein